MKQRQHLNERNPKRVGGNRDQRTSSEPRCCTSRRAVATAEAQTSQSSVSWILRSSRRLLTASCTTDRRCETCDARSAGSMRESGCLKTFRSDVFRNQIPIRVFYPQNRKRNGAQILNKQSKSRWLSAETLRRPGFQQSGRGPLGPDCFSIRFGEHTHARQFRRDRAD